MPENIQHIRLFISAPSDVNEERKFALEVIEQLSQAPTFRDRVEFEVVAWDIPGTSISPQDALDKQLPLPSETDIVVVLLWSRMGTPLPFPDYQKPDGTPFLSGTEWEYWNAYEAGQKTGDPFLVVYRRTERIPFFPDMPDFTEKVKQWERVDNFFKSFYNPDGSIKQGINQYSTPDDFRKTFKTHLESLVVNLLQRRQAQERAASKTHLPVQPEDQLSEINGDQEDVAFTHFYPAIVPQGFELPLHVYVHLASVLNKVREDFEIRRNFSAQEITATETASKLFKRGTEFLIIPSIKNGRVVPPRIPVPWIDDIEHVQFTVKPDKNTVVGSGYIGQIRVFVESVPVAELPIIFNVSANPTAQQSIKENTRPRFKKLFISYSHQDTLVVKAIDRLYTKYPELETYIDYKFLKGGEYWWDEVKEKILEAEALQLFWSQNSSISENVKKEWQFALENKRTIIPIMLNPESTIPELLQQIHFEPFDQFISEL